MNLWLLLICFFFFCSSQISCLKRYTVSLDTPPRTRWTQIINDHLDDLPGVVEESKKYIPKIFQPFVWFVASKLSYFFDEQIREELEGIAEASKLPLGEIVGLNILYDIAAFDRKHIFGLGCTSIVGQNSKGEIYHGRNLDYDMTGLLKNITIFVDFTKNGKILYSGITFALYNGLLTGQRPGEFSVSLNARYSGAYIDNILMEFYTKFRRPVSFFLREVLETADNYDIAVDRLTKTHLISPSYIIVAGVRRDQGVVISRNRWKAADVYRLNTTRNQWYLVETNFDHWKGDHDPRRLTAIAELKKLGSPNIDQKTMFDVLSVEPVRNNLTVFSTVLSAANPGIFYNSTLVRF